MRLLPTPGHTPGHIAVQISSNSQTALVAGNCIHHPIQFAHPTISSCVDIDPEQSETSRRKLLGALADTDTLLLGTHFPPPTAGHVTTRGEGYRLSPVPATPQVS
ncbi:hypothetical protein I3F55_15910 [Streptomyces sp. MUM 16J]|nr:hypothetical protein [Streptomyces sp. MUM 16J]